MPRVKYCTMICFYFKSEVGDWRKRRNEVLSCPRSMVGNKHSGGGFYDRSYSWPIHGRDIPCPPSSEVLQRIFRRGTFLRPVTVSGEWLTWVSHSESVPLSEWVSDVSQAHCHSESDPQSHWVALQVNVGHWVSELSEWSDLVSHSHFQSQCNPSANILHYSLHRIVSLVSSTSTSSGTSSSTSSVGGGSLTWFY